MKALLAWTIVPLLAVTALAQTAKPRSKKSPAKAVEPQVTAADVQALRDALAAQQQQIQQLQQSLAQRDQAVQTAQQTAQQAQTAASDAQQKVAAAQASSADKDAVAKLSSGPYGCEATVQSELLSSQDEQKARVASLKRSGPLPLDGDVRIRGESFRQQGSGRTATVPVYASLWF